MENIINIFMQQVRDATYFSFLHPIKSYRAIKKRRQFTKKILNGSPSLGVLWYFAEFIRYCEIIFFYDNNPSAKIYSSKNYDPCESGFVLNLPEATIIVKLYSDSQTVAIDIKNKLGSKITTNYTFENNQWTKEPDAYDILHIDHIIDIINRSMIEFMNTMIDIRLDRCSYDI